MQISSDIRSLSITNLEKILLRENFEKYRATQIFDWLTKGNIRSFEEMKNLPKELIHFLNSRFKIHLEKIKNFFYFCFVLSISFTFKQMKYS